MPRKGHTEEQILQALRQAEGGEKVTEICRKLGISEQTFYTWKPLYTSLGLSELRQSCGSCAMRELAEAEEAGRGSIAGSTHAAGDRPKKALKPRHRRVLARWTQLTHQVSERRVSRLLLVPTIIVAL